MGRFCWIRDILIRILLFSSLTFETPTKNYFFLFSVYFRLCLLPRYFLNMKIPLHHFQTLKVMKKSQTSRNQGFTYYFCFNYRRIRIRTLYLRLTDPDPGGPKHLDPDTDEKFFRLYLKKKLNFDSVLIVHTALLYSTATVLFTTCFESLNLSFLTKRFRGTGTVDMCFPWSQLVHQSSKITSY